MLRRFAAIACLSLVAPCAASGASSPTVQTEHAVTTLRVESMGLKPGAVATLLLDQTLQEGWHVYWKNPGDSGLPLDLQWALPEGFAAGGVVYPTPSRIPIGPLANYGFFGSPAFLIPLQVPAAAKIGDSVEIGLKATWLICEEICVPEEAQFSLTMPIVGVATSDPEVASLFAEARAAIPVPLGADGTFAVDGSAVIFSFPAPNVSGGNYYFFPETESLIEPSAPQNAARRGEKLVIETAAASGAASAPDSMRGVLARVGSAVGYEVELARDPGLKRLAGGAVASGSGEGTGGPAGGRWGGVGLMLAFAFLGGVILNIMPCVFPVIFIKAATLMKTGGAARRDVRRSGIAY
ncbi:MAG: hypothetical protein K2Q06_08715, partial [Parvularculaceae bacterium]|nr:hypothetical protein [Parvularculaceae bacterium]